MTISKRFQDIMNDLKSAGTRALKDIPVDLLAIDSSYQTEERTRSKNREEQVAKLARKWDKNKLEPITVVPHLEEGLFYVVNGYGRWKASQMLSPRYEYLCATVLLGAMNLDQNERRKFESELFAYQNREVAPLKPIQIHGALKNLGNKEVLLLEKMQSEYGFGYTNEKGTREQGILGSYTEVLGIAGRQGEGCLKYIFDICRDSAFDRKPNGYASYVLRALRDIWLLYPLYEEETKMYISKYFRDKMPLHFKAMSLSTYPLLDNRTACSLFLEDLLVSNIKIERKRIYQNGKVVKISA